MAASVPYDPLEPYDPAAWARELDAPAAAPRSAGQNTGLLSDYGTDIKRGLLQLPGAATGLADILVQGALGVPRAALEGASALTGDDTYHQASQALNQPWSSKSAEALGEVTGFEPGKWADQAQQEYSPERQAAKAEVEQAWKEGGAGNIAGAILSHPQHTIGGFIAEALPASVAGGFLGRGIAALAQTPRVLAAAPTLSKYLSPVAAGGKGFAFGAGEGAVAAGMHMEQATEQGAPADLTALTGLGVLGTTGALGVLGGKLANKVGIGDIEQAMAGAARGEAATTGLAGRLAEAAMQPTWAGRGTRVGFGALSEGLLEEAPQSAFEQIWQNVATGQDLATDLTRSAIEGALAGAGMGGAFNALSPGQAVAPNQAPPAPAGPAATPAATSPIDLTAPPTQEVTPNGNQAQNPNAQEVPGQGQGPDVRERQDAAVQEGRQGEGPLLTPAPAAPAAKIIDLSGMAGGIGDSLRDALWEGYSAGTGGARNDPYVEAARKIANRRGRAFDRDELDRFGNDFAQARDAAARAAVANRYAAIPAADPAQAQADALAAQQAVDAIQQQKTQETWQKRRDTAAPRLAAGKTGIIVKGDELALAQADPNLNLVPFGTDGRYRIAGVRNPDTGVWTGQPPIIKPAAAAPPGGANALEVPQAGEVDANLRAPVGPEVGQDQQGPVPVAEGSQGVREGRPESQEAVTPVGVDPHNAALSVIASRLSDPASGWNSSHKGTRPGGHVAVMLKALGGAKASPENVAAAKSWLQGAIWERLAGGKTALRPLGEQWKAEVERLLGKPVTGYPVSHVSINNWVNEAAAELRADPAMQAALAASAPAAAVDTTLAGATAEDLFEQAREGEGRADKQIDPRATPIDEAPYRAIPSAAGDTTTRTSAARWAARLRAEAEMAPADNTDAQALLALTPGEQEAVAEGEIAALPPELRKHWNDAASDVSMDARKESRNETEAQRKKAVASAEEVLTRVFRQIRSGAPIVTANADKANQAAIERAQAAAAEAAAETASIERRNAELMAARARAGATAWEKLRRLVQTKFPNAPDWEALSDDERGEFGAMANDVVEATVAKEPAAVSAGTADLFKQFQRIYVNAQPTTTAGASAPRSVSEPDTGAGQGEPGVPSQPKSTAVVTTKRPKRAVQPPGNVTPQLGQAPVGTPTTRGKFESVIRALIGRTNNWRLHLYDTADAAEAAGAPAEALANGAYGWVLADQNGKKHAYFILDRVETGTELGKFLHEVGAHLGLETILTQAQYTALFQSLVTWADKGRAGDQSLEAQIALRALARIEQAGTPADQTKFEAIAYFIEEAVAAGVDPTALNYKSELGRWFRTLWAAFKKALRKLGMKNIDKLTAQHVVDLAYGAARLELAGHWHGSLPAFRRFDSSYMSTGAGDQWYAWGHYVAKRKGVAEHYRKMVEDKANDAAITLDGVVVDDADALVAAGLDYDTANSILNVVYLSQPDDAKLNKRLDAIIANNDSWGAGFSASQWIEDNRSRLAIARSAQEAQLHRVDTNVLPEETMHWDKPLSEQPQLVQEAIRNHIETIEDDELMEGVFLNVPDIGQVELSEKGDPTGEEIYTRIVAADNGDIADSWRDYRHTSSKAASMFLDSIGIKAMEHWDEPSRNAGPPMPMLFFDGDPLGIRYSDITSAGGYDRPEAEAEVYGLRGLMSAWREIRDLPNANMQALLSNATARTPPEAANWIKANSSRVSIKTPPDTRSTNLVVFNDKNIHTIARAPGGDLSRIQYGIDAPLRAMYDKVATQLDDAKLDAKEAARRIRLSLLSIKQLAQRYKTPGLGAYADVMMARDMDTTDMLKIAGDINANWLPLPKAEAKQLSKLQLMVRYNQEKFDPTLGKPPVGYGTALTAPGSPVYENSSYDIWDRWNALPGSETDPTTAKGLYVAVQNYYKAQNAAMAETVQTMIDDLTAQGADVGVGTKANRLKALVDLLDALKRPYPIPLVRLGGWHVVGMSDRLAQLEAKQDAYQDMAARMARDGTLATNPDALDPWRLTDDEVEERTKLRKDPAHYVVKGARSASAARRMAGELESQLGHAEWNVNKARLPRNLMGDLPVLDAFRERVAGSMSPEAAAQAEELLRETVFDMLPENSDLKRMLKSEGIYGAEEDTQRVFADTVVPRAHRISAIKYAQGMADALRQINEDAKGPNKTIERALQNEVVKHSAMAMTYQSNPWVDRALTLSFLNFLGGSVSFLVTNMHQVPVVALPKIAARVGPGRQGVTRAAKALWKALGEVGGLRNKQRMIKIVKSGPGRWHAELDLSRLTPGELAAAEEMIRQRVLETTIQQELGDQGLFGPGKLSNVVRTLSMPVQASELLNRAAVGLASYRLGMEMYNDQKKATDMAVEMVHDSQIGYSSIDVPRAMESVLGSRPLAKLMFLFWRYRQGMLYLALSAAYDAYKGETPEVKAEARRVLKGMGAMTALTAGVFEMPLVSGTLGAASIIANALGAGGDEDDEPVDLQVWARNMLHDINPAFGEAVSKGAWSLLGADMSKRVGMGDLANPLAFARIQGQKGQDDFNAILGALAGAPAGMVGTTLNGIYEMGRGNTAKGIEQIVPLKMAKDMLGALRLSEEGLKTGTGGQVFAPEAITGQEVLTKLLGAQPLRIGNYYEANAAIQAQSAATQNARQRIITEYATAALRREPLADTRERIAAFNKRHPQAGVRITYETLARATQDRKRLTTKRTPSGILETKQMKPFTEYGRFGERG